MRWINIFALVWIAICVFAPVLAQGEEQMRLMNPEEEKRTIFDELQTEKVSLDLGMT